MMNLLDSPIFVRLVVQVIALALTILIWWHMEAVPGNGGRKPLRMLMAALTLMRTTGVLLAAQRIRDDANYLVDFISIGSASVVIGILYVLLRMMRGKH